MASHSPRLSIASWLAIGLSIASIVCVSTADAQEPDSNSSFQRIEFVMYSDPAFEVRGFPIEISNEAIPLWVDAMSRPDSLLQRVAIDTIAVAHRRGMKGIDVTVPKLVELLDQAKLAPEVRYAAVNAIVELDARDHAEMLVRLAEKHGGELSALVESALTRWQSPLMVENWIRRVNDTGAGHRSLVLAIAGLGALAEKDASEVLLGIANDTSLAPTLRITAARSLGQIHDTGLQSQAAELVDTTPEDVTSDLMAIAMMNRHVDADTVTLLKGLMDRSNRAVQSEAIRRLYEIDFKNVLEFAPQAVNSPDVNVRRTAARAMIDAKDSQWIASLAMLLNDVNPGLRSQVAEGLFEIAQDASLRDEVISQVSSILDQDAWRGCEQATLVLVNLDHKPAGDRLVDLISHPRGEVMSTAGWGLRRLGLKKHLPAMLGRSVEIQQGFAKNELNPGMPGLVDLQAQLFLAFGQMKYLEADKVVRAYIPKNFDQGERARSAAAWAIGLIHAGDASDDLVKLLAGRLNDSNSMVPEYESVRQMCALSLGRINSQESLPDLRKHAENSGYLVSRSCYWSIEKMTGETPPPVAPRNPMDYDDWFLRPIQ